MALDQDQLGNARLEYQEICKSYQSIGDTRLKLLGFLPLSSGVGIYAVIGDGGSSIPPFAWVAGLFGFLVTLGLFFYELRGLQRSAALERIGRELETSLGLAATGQFSAQPEGSLGGLVDVRGAAWVIYTTVLGAWAYLTFVRNLGTFWAALVAAAIALIVSFVLARRTHSADVSDQTHVALREEGLSQAR
jgi:hypothetical protein